MGSSAFTLVDGFCEVLGGKIWYQVIAPDQAEIALETDSLPLVFIHGGPGYTHNSFRTLTELSKKRKIIFYDQLGCGKSDRPSDFNLWTVQRHVEELKSLIKHLELSECYLLGHSWGSIVALEFMQKYSDVVQGVIFASPCLSVPLWIEDSKRLRKQLPKEVDRVLKLGEQLGEFHTSEYLEAASHYAKRFIYSLDPKPQELLDSDAQAGAEVYLTMWGPNEFTLLGSLANYNGIDKLQSIQVPTLFTCGRFDEATPEACEIYKQEVENSALMVFEQSAHFPHVEEKYKYLDFLDSYLEDLDHGKQLGKEFSKTKPAEIFTIILILAFALLIVLYIFVS